MIAAARRFLVGQAAAAVDVAFTRATEAMARSSGARGAERLDHETRMHHLGLIAEQYPGDSPGYFRAPRSIRPTRTPVKGLPLATDLVWESDYSAFSPALEQKFLAASENRLVSARHLGQTPGRSGTALRPIVILIHGYLGGNFAVEQRVFPVEWLTSLGLDCVLFTLPFHGRRAEAGRRVPRFPGSDPRTTLEGFRQAMGDLGDLIEYFLAQGHPHVGVMGMSLGGYSTALIATLEARLAFAVPIIPLSSFADWARDHGRLTPEPSSADAEYAALERVYQVISPLHRAPVLETRRLLILGAEHDRITPMHHAERLSKHFRAPLQTFPGGHLMQVGRERGLRHFAVMVKDLGVGR